MFEKSNAPRLGSSARGFTLIEAMIATLVFAIGMMAVITMEFSAIRAYRVAQDQTIATEIAERTVSFVEIEAANWSGTDITAAIAENNTGSAPPEIGSLYNDSSSPLNGSGTSGQAVLTRITSAPWTWNVLTDTPVDTQMAKNEATNSELGRYCVYARGGFSNLALGGATGTNTGGMDVAVTPLVQMQVAVVYPSSSTGFERAGDCNQIQCNGTPVTVTDLLQPEGLAGAMAPQLDVCGWRAVYKAALISR